jgi:hypothetical protein
LENSLEPKVNLPKIFLTENLKGSFTRPISKADFALPLTEYNYFYISENVLA